jgi:hypothetical protein
MEDLIDDLSVVWAAILLLALMGLYLMARSKPKK